MSTTPQVVPSKPPEDELVTRQVLRHTGLNAQAFSGNQNPSSVYRLMVAGSPNVFPYYRELIEKDLTLDSAFELRQLLVTRRSADVKSANEGDARADEFADAASRFVESVPNWDGFIDEIMDAPPMGYVVQEVVWKRDANGAQTGGRMAVGVEKIVGRPQELFTFNPITEPQTGELLLSQFAGANGEPVPERKFLVTSYKVKNGDRRGTPILRRLYWPSWFTRNAQRLELQFLEKPVGTVAVKYGQAADAEEQNRALSAAEAIVNEVAVAFPEGLQIVTELLSTARTREGKDFTGMIDRLSNLMVRRILGASLTTQASEQGVGSRGMGRVHQETTEEVTAKDGTLVEGTANTLIGWWGLFTFGPEFLNPDLRPWYTIDKEPPRDALEAGQRLQIARDLNPPSGIPEDEVYNLVQVRRPQEGESTLPAPGLGMLPSFPEGEEPQPPAPPAPGQEEES